MVVTSQSSSHFESLESAHEYLALLREAVDEAHASILDDTEAAEREGATRRADALRVVEHKLNRLRQNLLASLLIVNDLRTLRRLLLAERASPATDSHDEP
jgi:hypothetical protein